MAATGKTNRENIAVIAADNNQPVETHQCEYFGCKIEVWKIKGPYWGSYPWRLAVTFKGNRQLFTGVPNYCETKKQALKRAWWRAKWLSTGKFPQRYYNI